MIASLNRNRIEVLLALVAIAALYYAAQGLLAMQDARAAYEDAVETRDDIESEAARYNLDALTAERDRLLDTTAGSAFPTRTEAELDLAAIATLLDDPQIELRSFSTGEIADEVTNSDIGAPGSGARQYRGDEMLLTLDGDVFDLLNLAQRLLAAVPNATVQDVSLTLATTAAEPSSLALRVLLYYEG